jgi:hypothetical protein
MHERPTQPCHGAQIAGWWRTAIIYFVSSMGGNLMSALLVPYHAYTGAAIPVYGLFGSIVRSVCLSLWILIIPAGGRACLLVAGPLRCPPPPPLPLMHAQLLTYARSEALKLAVVGACGVFLGFIPYVDNLGQSHTLPCAALRSHTAVFGFIFGALAAITVLPFVPFADHELVGCLLSRCTSA